MGAVGALVRIHDKWRFGGCTGRILDSVYHGNERWWLVGFAAGLELRTHWFHAMQFDLLACPANEPSEVVA